MLNNELLELIKNNPELPVFAWVDGEICAEDCGYWLGQFGTASIQEYAKVEPYDYYDRDFIFKDDYIEYMEYILEKEENINMTEEEAKQIIANLDYKKALDKLNEDKLQFDFVFLDPPYHTDFAEEAVKIPNFVKEEKEVI